ncbi:MAG: hypothetical protein HQK97_03985 [Nitrospirae bacterium]|nr:hypothetical protein [Nitrospirota bacterium]
MEIDVDQLVGYLSGGERQMLNVVIATHLEHENNPCKLILLDEHTSGLDHKNAFRVMSFTQKKIKETKTTAIMVTHRYSDAIEYSDRIVVMGNGAIKDIYIKSDENWSVDKLTKAVENFS